MARYRTLFISDVHLGTRNCQAEALCDFLDNHDAETLYLVGDIVDFWRIKRGAFWTEAQQDKVNLQWMNKITGLLEKRSVGHFISEADLTAAHERAQKCFLPDNWDRLIALRTKYDPGRLFHSFPGID